MSARTGIIFSTAAVIAMLFFAALAFAADLPPDFTRLADVDPTIRQDIRYSGSDNFLGRPARGYEAPVCILTRPAAEALAEVQKSIASDGLTLVVFDCYRPARAVADFVAWTKEPGSADPRWYPKVKRSDLIAEGYIGEKSSHSRGSTVDLAIAPLTGPGAPDPACGAAGTGILDFGTGFDCFDEASETAHRPLSFAAEVNRKRLLDEMTAAGFANYRGEWWHFTLKAEPFKDRRFDFPVTASP